ncbi:MAG: twitching motility protein PilT, partial [Acidimicrobiales bacterium]
MTPVYDAGELLRLERGDREAWHRWRKAIAVGRPPLSHGGVVGQVWRHGARQARLSVALRGVRVVSLDDRAGRRAG